MKLSIALLASTFALNQERAILRELRQARNEKKARFGKPERFVYQYPFCPDVDTCANEDDRCDGQVFEGGSGSIVQRAYGDVYNCRWEIQAEPGNTVGLKFYGTFDLEWDRNCGYDRVHIRCLDDPTFTNKHGESYDNIGQPISRVCGPKGKAVPHWPNGFDALKIVPSKTFFKQSDDTGCKRLLIEFNTDQDTQGQLEQDGFKLGFYMNPSPDNTEDPCNKKGSLNIINCLKQGAKKAGRDEYQKIKNAFKNDDSKKGKKTYAKYVRIEADRIARVDMHVDNYMRKMTQTVGRCGMGHAATFDAKFYSDLKNAAASGSADKMFSIWNRYAVQTLTGDEVSCGWYDPSLGDEGIEESSFPCRTRRVFLKMQGKTQFGQYVECSPEDFSIDDNELF